MSKTYKDRYQAERKGAPRQINQHKQVHLDTRTKRVRTRGDGKRAHINASMRGWA